MKDDSSADEPRKGRHRKTDLPFEALIADLNRNLPRSTVREQHKDSVRPDLQHRAQLIRFMIDDVVFAIRLSKALEIGRLPAVTPLPGLPEWVMGVSNIRGEIISMVDLGAFFDIAPLRQRRERRFLVVHVPDMKVGIVVDRILGIFSPDPGELLNPDLLTSGRDFKTPAWTAYISRFLPTKTEVVLHILDVEKLLSSSRMNAFDSH